MPVSDSMIAGLIDLNRADDEGLVAQLTGQLRGLIAAGRIAKGRALPSSRRLASDLGVSRNTVTYAFEQLAAEGYLAASHGRRPVVTIDGGVRIDGARRVQSVQKALGEDGEARGHGSRTALVIVPSCMPSKPSRHRSSDVSRPTSGRTSSPPEARIAITRSQVR